MEDSIDSRTEHFHRVMELLSEDTFLYLTVRHGDFYTVTPAVPRSPVAMVRFDGSSARISGFPKISSGHIIELIEDYFKANNINSARN